MSGNAELNEQFRGILRGWGILTMLEFLEKNPQFSPDASSIIDWAERKSTTLFTNLLDLPTLDPELLKTPAKCKETCERLPLGDVLAIDHFNGYPKMLKSLFKMYPPSPELVGRLLDRVWTKLVSEESYRFVQTIQFLVFFDHVLPPDGGVYNPDDDILYLAFTNNVNTTRNFLAAHPDRVMEVYFLLGKKIYKMCPMILAVVKAAVHKELARQKLPIPDTLFDEPHK
jgi:hypothetical protein